MRQRLTPWLANFDNLVFRGAAQHSWLRELGFTLFNPYRICRCFLYSVAATMRLVLRPYQCSGKSPATIQIFPRVNAYSPSDITTLPDGLTLRVKQRMQSKSPLFQLRHQAPLQAKFGQ